MKSTPPENLPITMEEKLDLILAEMRDRHSRPPTRHMNERLCRLVTGGNGVDTGNHDYQRDQFFRSLVHGLRVEGFVVELYNDSVTEKYDVASVKGLMFEGFVNQKIREEREREATNRIQEEQRALAIEQVKLSRRLTTMNRQMVILTIVIAIGAVVVAWADFLEIWEYYYPNSYFRF